MARTGVVRPNIRNEGEIKIRALSARSDANRATTLFRFQIRSTPLRTAGGARVRRRRRGAHRRPARIGGRRRAGPSSLDLGLGPIVLVTPAGIPGTAPA